MNQKIFFNFVTKSMIPNFFSYNNNEFHKTQKTSYFSLFFNHLLINFLTSFPLTLSEQLVFQ